MDFPKIIWYGCPKAYITKIKSHYLGPFEIPGKSPYYKDHKAEGLMRANLSNIRSQAPDPNHFLIYLQACKSVLSIDLQFVSGSCCQYPIQISSLDILISLL